MLNKLGLDSDSSIYQYYVTYGGFNNEHLDFDYIYDILKSNAIFAKNEPSKLCKKLGYF